MKFQRNNKGFTLTEVLIAVSILSIAIVPMLANFVYSSRVNYKSRRTMNGTIVAQNIMEGINAYGVENTIIQLEDVNPTPSLKFLPASMKVGNWGRCTFNTKTIQNTESETVTVPVYDKDDYQDDTRNYEYDSSGNKVDFQDIIMMTGREPGVYEEVGGNDTTNLNPSHTARYIYKPNRPGDDNTYFLDDSRKEAINDAHAYMFWLRNVEYGSKKYDVLLTMDANYYREYSANALDTRVDVSSVSNIQAKISNPADPDNFNNKRTYNDEMLSRITNNTGTNAAIDDTTPDRFSMEADNKFDLAVSDFVARCKVGVTREQVMAGLQRQINIEVTRENNPADSSKPYYVITLAYEFRLLNTSLLDPLNSMANIDVKREAPIEIFKSCQQSPRNIYIYYLPNYEAYSTPGALGGDIINIKNVGGDVEGTTTYGTDMNLFLVRHTTNYNVADTTLLNTLSTNENAYKVKVNVTENLKNNDLKNLNTHIFTNIGYNLANDSKIAGMGSYTVNGTSISDSDVTNKMRVGSLDGINREAGATQKDYIYEVTVQVFEPDHDFDMDARIAKFTGSSN
ncbi:MAG: prepilin-type N-terminal cleavage/methylation domain-containing protein [Lachnospiraceae bacterium]|nr:prepilin-type N-terminal cleavage/methylation domain-containing protein [Lachnospiraceae bacterium]